MLIDQALRYNSRMVDQPTQLPPGVPPNAALKFKGQIFDVYQWDQKMFDGSVEVFEKLKRPNTAVVIATAHGKILVQKQEQPGEKPQRNLPGGRCNGKEDPLLAAKRELLEETGYVSDDWSLWREERPFTKIIWKVYIYIAKNCTQRTTNLQLDAGEKIENSWVTLEEFIALSENQSFRDKELIPDLLRLQLHPEEKIKFERLIFG